MRINLDRNWKFFLGDLAPKTDADEWGGAKSRGFFFGAPARKTNDEKWRTVHVPHDFVSEGEYTRKSGDGGMTDIPEMESIDSRLEAGGSLEGGVAWYRRHFTLDKAVEGKRVYLVLDGVYRDCTVYLNEYLIGSQRDGYTAFCFDVTDFVSYDTENLLAVRVDARGREGWWYEGGGIYRPVYLDIRETVAAEPDGVFAAAVPHEDGARVEVRTEVRNREMADADVLVKSIIRADGEDIAEICAQGTVPMWETAALCGSAEIENAHLWSLDDPYLYTLVTRIYSAGKLTDERETRFGVREIRFDADRGFFLNGEHIKIQGVCAHHDHAGCGIGMPESVQEYRIDMLKKTGANAFRSAHYPLSEELLNICDRKGMLVFDEVRHMSSSENDLAALRMMVRRGRNHPSVILYGIGNEEIFSQDKPETARTTITMRTEVRKLDPTRPVTSAVVCWNGEQRFDTAEGYIDVTKHLDVMGFNYCTSAWDDYHERMPHQPVTGTENSGNGWTRGCYSTDERLGHYYTFDPDNINKVRAKRKAIKRDMGESEWKFIAERDYIAGSFIWTGIDYRGEMTPLAYPAVYSQFGMLDYCGFMKDSAYYYQSVWSKEDVLHIFPHWTMPGREGEKISVFAFTNCDEAELFVNGVSYGRRKCEKYGYIEWENVTYEPGEAKAVGYRDGEIIKECSVRTTGAPAGIETEIYNKEIRPYDAVIVNIRIVDESGEVVPYADNILSFDIVRGELIGTGNGDPGDHDSEKASVRRAFNGLCQLLVRADGEGRADVRIKASCGECRVMR